MDSWRLRPDAATAVPNLFLASDYVRTNTDLATMEGANEAARHAVNALLDRDGHAAPRCRIWPLHEPLALAPLREYDAVRFGLGLPWDGGLVTVAAAAVETADPVLGPVAAALAGMAPDTQQLQSTLDQMDRATPLLEEADDLAERIGQELGGVRDELEGSVPVLDRETQATRFGRNLATPPQPQADVPEGPAGFAERLAWYRDLTLTAMDDAIPTTEPREHLYSPLRTFVAQPSKGLRPGLCLAVCRAFGGRASDAIPSAAGIEMLHNAFLVHDDIEDGSEARRGAPTLHRQLGTPLAVNVGDAMNALSMRLFRQNVERVGPERALRIFDEVDHMLRESLEGQALELGWTKDNRCDLDLDDYLRLVLKKTAWYSFIHPMRIGAHRRRRGRRRPEPLRRLRIPPGRRVPDPGRPAEPRRRRRPVRQGDRRRPLGGQAHPAAPLRSGHRTRERAGRRWRSSQADGASAGCPARSSTSTASCVRAAASNARGRSPTRWPPRRRSGWTPPSRARRRDRTSSSCARWSATSSTVRCERRRAGSTAEVCAVRHSGAVTCDTAT